MAREDASPMIKKHCGYVTALFIIVGTICAACFLVSRPLEPKSSDKLVTNRIPKVYRLEHVEPEDRDVFQYHGLKTSFLPSEEIVLARKVNGSDCLLWKDEEESDSRARIKRSHPTFYEDYDYNSSDQKSDELEVDDPEEYVDNEENKDKQGPYPIKRESTDIEQMVERVIHPEKGVDKGPLDEVKDENRVKPEEEGDVIGSSLVDNEAKYYGGLRAFWKAQGDRHLIRKTQADIMMQYMDKDADPCEDFYQFACGNWKSRNPIPPEKAGYNTFELLREYLQTVLRDLLESNKHDMRPDYPGANLDLNEQSVQDITMINKRDILYGLGVDSNPKHHNHHNNQDFDGNANQFDIVNRIRRYLYKKGNEKQVKAISKIKDKIDTLLKRRNIKKLYKRKKVDYYHSMPFKALNKKISKRAVLEETAPNKSIVKKINDDEGSESGADAVTKAVYLYNSCMNYNTLSKRGVRPLLDFLDIFGGWPILDPNWNAFGFNWQDVMSKLRLFNIDILISEWVGPDIKDSDQNIIQFDQPSLGLPSRNYFLNDDNKDYLNGYKKFIIKIAELLGGNKEHVKHSADELIEFEIRLANITSPAAARRNVSELYQRMSIRKLGQLVPQIKWRRYLEMVMNRTVNPDEMVVIFALTYVKDLVPLIESTRPRTVANYLLWRFVRHRINNLDDRFKDAKQSFYFLLFGQEKTPPRWHSCVDQVKSNMGMAMGSLYVRKYFDENCKNDTMVMTKAIREAFRELLHETDWLDHETKTMAVAKVDSMSLKIGYPDFILHETELNEKYKAVKVHPEKFFENILNILRHVNSMEQSSLTQPVDKSLWLTAPAVVNAYYSRNKNQIIFPAGILQPPFYHRHFPKSINYGGIGVVIGHEIIHGFDDDGRLFDRRGNLHRWWSDNAVKNFHRRAQCLIDQYGRYVIAQTGDDEIKIDGSNTQGENIADNGGIKQAFLAYQQWRARHSAEDETLPGLNFTNTQLFFLNFAQVWCGSQRPEAIRSKIKTAVHSPGRFRVIGTLSNSVDFAREFGCPPGSPMNPVDKCTVW